MPRLALINSFSFAKILLGETTGLENLLTSELDRLHLVNNRFATIFQTTLADLYLCQGNVSCALEIYSRLWENSGKRGNLGPLANIYVRALIETGDFNKAVSVAGEAVNLTQELHHSSFRRALLAQGMAESFINLDAAIPLLESAREMLMRPLLAPRFLQATLFLANTYVHCGEKEKAKAVLEQTKSYLPEIRKENLKLLCGPEKQFKEIAAILFGPNYDVEVKFLGDTKISVNGEPQSLRMRLAEILAVLACYPHGVSIERLTLDVYGDRGDPASCRVELGRLKKILPIRTIRTSPYGLATNIWVDFSKFEDLIKSGELSAALRLYNGPLLPQSEAPRIIELREALDGMLRYAALSTGDTLFLLSLTDYPTFKDDLEIWESLEETLLPGDAKRAYVKANRMRLKGDFLHPS